MDKKELRRSIRDQKRAMSEAEIVQRSEKLAELFYASEAYKNAKTIYGYLPYNQEVRTVPMLERALKDGKRVAVPKCYGDEMKFIFMEDLTKVEKGYANIPEPIADDPVADDKTALVLMPGLAFDPRDTAAATAAVSMTNSWQLNPSTLPWLCAMNSRCSRYWKPRSMTSPLTTFSGHKKIVRRNICPN